MNRTPLLYTRPACRAAALFGLAALLVAGWPSSVRAQGVTTGAIAGLVTDQDGQPLEGVQVSVTDTRTGVTQGAMTNDAGQYFVPFLQPGGAYAVRVQLIGYRPSERRNVRISLSQTEGLDFQLEQTAVEVEGISVTIEGNPIFSRSRMGTATTIDEGEIESFPTIGRQITDFALLSPQIVSVEGAPSVAGQNNRFKNIQIDGAVNNDVFGLADSGIPGGFSRGQLELVFDLINVFANDFEQPSSIDRGIDILRLRGRVGSDPNGDLLFSYEGPPSRDGVFRKFSPTSQRQFQAGLRYRF